MKVPLSWLKEYVEIDATAQELAEKLTFSGTEVEGIQTVGGTYDGVVVGEILSVEPHPGADRLRLCRVGTGSGELLVVCGAPNLAVGDKAPFAGVGVTLPGGMVIRRACIRGTESFGMLCAEDELGISDDHSGLMRLPCDIAAGTPLAEVLGPPETVLTVEITWNRPDCLSMIGLAREVAALYRTRLKLPQVALREGDVPVEEQVRVAIEAPGSCPRYTARVLRDVHIDPSPRWMQRRLALCGLRPICNIVDVTNYVMLESGHPLHAFDYDLLEDGRIVVRHARDGERMVTLDGVERAVRPDMLVIADAHKPVALAGVMGGAGSEIRDESRTVLLEAACFDPAGIHRTSVALGLATESSHRFERGVDVDRAEWASRRAAALMVATGGGVLARGCVDIYPGKRPGRRVSLHFSRVRDLLGVEIADDEIATILGSLMLPVEERDAVHCTVAVPAFRTDIEIEADLIEEVARIHGLEEVPEVPPACHLVPGTTEASFRAETACRAALTGLGLSEIVNYSFLSPKLLNLVRADDGRRRVVLPNPVSEDQSVLRPSLIPQMVETLGRNLARQVHEAAFFEMGTVFLAEGPEHVGERQHICIGIMGPVGRDAMDKRRPVSPEECLLWLKGIVSRFIASQHVSGEDVEPGDAACFEPGSAAAVKVGGRWIGRFGVLRGDVRHEWRMQTAVGVAELDAWVLEELRLPRCELRAVTAFPSVSRDLALLVDETVTHRQIVDVIRKSAPAELTGIELFDIFRKEGIGQGRKSLAYSLEFRSAQRSLTDEDANGYHERIKQALRDKLNAETRDK